MNSSQTKNIDATCEQQDLDRGSPLRRLFLWWIASSIMIVGTGTFNGRQFLPHSFSWNIYIGIFWLILALSYVPEMLGTKYAKANKERDTRQRKLT